MAKLLHLIIKGTVQGVGFRWTLVDHAEKLQLTGTAQNLADGSVEVYAQGPEEHLEEFLETVKNDPGLARIESISAKYQTASRHYSSFGIKH